MGIIDQVLHLGGGAAGVYLGMAGKDKSRATI